MLKIKRNKCKYNKNKLKMMSKIKIHNHHKVYKDKSQLKR
jgi:hypothetical protein